MPLNAWAPALDFLRAPSPAAAARVAAQRVSGVGQLGQRPGHAARGHQRHQQHGSQGGDHCIHKGGGGGMAHLASDAPWPPSNCHRPRCSQACRRRPPCSSSSWGNGQSSAAPPAQVGVTQGLFQPDAGWWQKTQCPRVGHLRAPGECPDRAGHQRRQPFALGRADGVSNQLASSTSRWALNSARLRRYCSPRSRCISQVLTASATATAATNSQASRANSERGRNSLMPCLRPG